MDKQFNGERSNFSKEDLRILDKIANSEIDYCSCKEKQHPDHAFCGTCEKPIPGVDESSIRALIAITGANHYLITPKPSEE